MQSNIYRYLQIYNIHTMISSSSSKLIRSLRQKKFRDQHRLYLVEGDKIVKELLSNENPGGEHMIRQLFARGEWIELNSTITSGTGIMIQEADESEMKKISNLVTPQQVLALVSIPEPRQVSGELDGKTVLLFDAIRDPGNLGTIIRTADWFGIDHIVCSPDSTDVYNTKVVQATMGAIARVRVYYKDIETLLSGSGIEGRTVYGTFLAGEDIYGIKMSPDSLFLFGNESHGLPERYDPYITRRITIPSFSHTNRATESLNVASAVSVICSEIRRG